MKKKEVPISKSSWIVDGQENKAYSPTVKQGPWPRPLSPTQTGDPLLVSFSGGVDSTAMLYWLLENTTEELHVNHVLLTRDWQEKTEVEHETCQNIVHWLRENCREFNYSETRIGMPGYDYALDHLLYATVGAMFCLSGRFKRMCTGRIRTDESINGSRNFYRALKLFHAATAGFSSSGREIEWWTPINHLCKRDLIKLMPKELFKLTWSCHYPLKDDNGNWVECRECIGCVRRIEGMAQNEGMFEEIPKDILEKMEPEEYTDFVIKHDYKYRPPLTDFIGRLL
tara:strand:+ start:218 stop:1069 length:852 start_codon:yes stop_codon:yes gene_type:complete